MHTRGATPSCWLQSEQGFGCPPGQLGLFCRLLWPPLRSALRPLLAVGVLALLGARHVSTACSPAEETEFQLLALPPGLAWC